MYHFLCRNKKDIKIHMFIRTLRILKLIYHITRNLKSFVYLFLENQGESYD